jgi:hypothetical protein
MKKEAQLNWLRSQQLKDKNDVELNKRTIINQIKKINKEDLFTKTEEKPKYSLWQKIKVMIWGT